ncbi:uncharacterized protein BX663DRAFT_549295 [Cokeromyces recurvatus]|uniref:uncharacterized protein n=1 Tax=Cokeromyces recurvatus TaxID=90255 RepID=UPI00221FBACF|nr:uncharacterized protein BX663DRAFT_549295 [Cokeromyces recurvatus]KAI7906198.1 hypothetical protein BX663DRAFT_549295 [Cokeromyces recurvatus]
MKIFNKETVSLLDRNYKNTKKSNHYYHKNPTATTTLAHVMHLFEEKNKYPPLPFTGPLPIKANGAIVVHRPNHPIHINGDTYSDDDDDNDNDNFMMDNKGRDSSSKATTASRSSDSTEEEYDSSTAIQFIHEENKRLCQQILFERKQFEKWRNKKKNERKELVSAKQTIQELKQKMERLEKLFMMSLGHTDNKNGIKSLRRQSMGATVERREHLKLSNITCEQKIQVLLNEIEAMEQEEIKASKRLSIQKDEYERKIAYKDTMIQQLANELQLLKRRNF